MRENFFIGRSSCLDPITSRTTSFIYLDFLLEIKLFFFFVLSSERQQIKTIETIGGGRIVTGKCWRKTGKRTNVSVDLTREWFNDCWCGPTVRWPKKAAWLGQTPAKFTHTRNKVGPILFVARSSPFWPSIFPPMVYSYLLPTPSPFFLFFYFQDTLTIYPKTAIENGPNCRP